jgi:hypothetical protein
MYPHFIISLERCIIGFEKKGYISADKIERYIANLADLS